MHQEILDFQPVPEHGVFDQPLDQLLRKMLAHSFCIEQQNKPQKLHLLQVRTGLLQSQPGMQALVFEIVIETHYQ